MPSESIQYMLESHMTVITAVILSGFVSKSFAHLDCTLLFKKSLQALLSWLSIIARQPLLSHVLDFEAELSQTVTRPFRNNQCRLRKQIQCIFGYRLLPC